MPTYCYRDDDGNVYERVYSMGQAEKTIKVDGRVAHRSFQDEMVGVPAKSGWPLECLASGVNAAQAGELKKHLADKGVPTEVSRDGNPIYRDSAHRKKALAVRGIHDRSSFY